MVGVGHCDQGLLSSFRWKIREFESQFPAVALEKIGFHVPGGLETDNYQKQQTDCRSCVAMGIHNAVADI